MELKKPMKKITEKPSLYDHLEKMSTAEILTGINTEDKKVAIAVEKALPSVCALVERIVEKLRDQGGRLFYIGAGTSGRLGVLDASECPPTFGVSPDLVIGIIAGGDTALRLPVENAEDDETGAWGDLQDHGISDKDVIIGIAASGTTAYVIGGIQEARQRGLLTACITCNPGSPLSTAAEFPVEVEVGPEFVTGSTRMKSGTAQKMVLNMISTATMIRLGRIKGNKMVDMQLSNKKLISRGERMVMEELGVDQLRAAELLTRYKSVRKVLEHFSDDAD